MEGQAYRNVNIDTYVPAMEAIVERGGWVIRYGDAGMQAILNGKMSLITHIVT